MYMSAFMAIDPSQLTQLRRKPTRGFRRFAELLTVNLISKKEEHETFTALSIMQEINQVLRSLGVTDVVKFTKDGNVLYEDPDSLDRDDMPLALEALKRNNDCFTELSCLLEHHLKSIALVIEIKVQRIHDIGVFPIQITINGLDAELRAAAEQKELENRMEQLFATQRAYDDYVDAKRAEFDSFVQQLETTFRSKMTLDNLNRRVNTNIIRPSRELPANWNPSRNSSDAGLADSGDMPIFDRHSHDSDALAYCWMWANFMNHHNTHCHDATVVTPHGDPLFSVGHAGFMAGESPALDPDASFQLPDCPVSDVAPDIPWVNPEVSDNAMMDYLQTSSSAMDDGAKSSGWLDLFSFSSDSSDSGSHDSGSSCSSCSSCGGGD